MGIYAEFKYGSAKSARENLQLPQLQLLGLSLVDLQSLQSQSELERHKLPLDQCDRTRLNNLLVSDVGRNDLAIRSVSPISTARKLQVERLRRFHFRELNVFRLFVARAFVACSVVNWKACAY
jgi:DNA topoisomerase VI subunit A